LILPLNPKSLKKHLIVVGGPTASGKTALAIEIALHFQTEIISADSRQFFKELTIGTAKPSSDQLSQVKHHFISSHSIVEEFNAADFGTHATKTINSIFEEKDFVVMVGGSGLFIDAVIKGFDELPTSDLETRNRLQSLLNSEGLESLQSMLLELDPVSHGRIDLNNPRRVIRALEVSIVSGTPYSTQLGNRKKEVNEWNIIMTGIDFPRAALYQRIDQRTTQMILDGLIDEARSVIAFRDKNALQTVGYKEAFMHLDGIISLPETERLIAQHTRNYAKRQTTWFKRYHEMKWLSPDKPFQQFKDSLSG
jgi:tRNA dimethylallyltransferase